MQFSVLKTVEKVKKILKILLINVQMWQTNNSSLNVQQRAVVVEYLNKYLFTPKTHHNDGFVSYKHAAICFRKR